jgi:hypothetical protein
MLSEGKTPEGVYRGLMDLSRRKMPLPFDIVGVT